jgi:hypothetical protein
VPDVNSINRTLITRRESEVIQGIRVKKDYKMYIKRVDGPRAVTLKDGTVLTLADLPPKDTRRWVASRKVTVIKAVDSGLLSKQAAMERYDLSEEELDLWQNAVRDHGVDALKVTALQKYRHA